MATFLLLLKEAGTYGIRLGDFQFMAIPRTGEYINRLVHEDLDKDEAPVPKDDQMDDEMRKRLYRVDAVVHFVEPLKREGEDTAVNGYLIVSNAGGVSRFNKIQHGEGRSWFR